MVLTGGEPVIARDVAELTVGIRATGRHLTIETAATIPCKGLKPRSRPIVAALAEVPVVDRFWLRPGTTAGVSAADTFWGDTLARLPAGVRIGLVRADSGFYPEKMLV